MKEEFLSAIEKCSNTLTLGLDKLFWKHLKRTVKDDAYLNKLIDMANKYINIGYWPLHFKVSTTIIIPKSNKESYDSSKVYQPIVLFNTIGKLFEKVISEILQFMLISTYIFMSIR